MRYLLNVNQGISNTISRRFTSRNKCIWNCACSHKITQHQFQVRPGAAPGTPCSGAALENSPRISHRLPQRPESGLKRAKECMPGPSRTARAPHFHAGFTFRRILGKEPMCRCVAHLSLGQVNDCEQS